MYFIFFFFFSSRRRHTRFDCDWSSDVCSSDLTAFSCSGDYAKSLAEDPLEAFAFFDESLELSRRFRALKLWLSLRYHGLAAFRSAIRTDLRHAQSLAELIRGTQTLELLAPVQLSARSFP